jgi:hypothetical protein
MSGRVRLGDDILFVGAIYSWMRWIGCVGGEEREMMRWMRWGWCW